MRVQVMVGVVGAALLLAGCGSGAVDGKADAVGAAAGEPVFSPCDDIPDDALQAVGVDPATASRDIQGVKQPGWNICGWRGQGYTLSVFATTRTFEEVRLNPRNTNFEAVQVGSREAVSYQEVGDHRAELCDIALRTETGAVLVRAILNTADSTSEDRCAIALRSARGLEPYVPR
ncbi:DUF3558 domain-containing protein [Rhodococcus spelaei]|uniref:DUF3558 domain-containing protein n=1 Tax=Rhodococcus spelaei TaxID=2546320 RepID=A0A541B0E1_9NOCA|nr:DUF3558 domain-containing protein [Rhodococcus spelaei]TQF65772.1 DUF3558 domain-containing protein [Rhodococcus spelaei]